MTADKAERKLNCIGWALRYGDLGRKATQAAVLAALGAHNVMIVPHGVVLAS